MEQISIRAVIASNLVQLGLVFGLAFLVSMGSLAVGWIWAGFPGNIKPVIAGLKSLPLFMTLAPALTVIASSVLAGYLAGRMADRRPLLHGALSSCAWIFLLILVMLFGLPIGHTPHEEAPAASQGFSAGSFLVFLLRTAMSIGTPLLGVLGAMIVHRRRSAALSPAPSKETAIGELPRFLMAKREMIPRDIDKTATSSLRRFRARPFLYRKDGQTRFYDNGPYGYGYLVPDSQRELELEDAIPRFELAYRIFGWLMMIPVLASLASIEIQYSDRMFAALLVSVAIMAIGRVLARNWYFGDLIAGLPRTEPLGRPERRSDDLLALLIVIGFLSFVCWRVLWVL